jgi:hypothetical protein
VRECFTGNGSVRRLPAFFGAGGRRGVFFQRCVGVGCVEAEDENMRRHVRKGMAAGN